MADGTLRLSVDVEPENAEAAFRLFGMPGVAGAICRLTEEASQQRLQNETIKIAYGEQAKTLRLSSFFRTPEVWHMVGSDSDFLRWLTINQCAAKHIGSCDGDVVAAHVRRISNGSGTGRKPEYSAIPLCDAHHRIQHQHGESSLGGKEWFDKKRIEYVQQWCWDKLKADLGYESWSQIPPDELIEWADSHSVSQYLPANYK